MNDCIIQQGHNVVFDKQPDQACAFVVALRDISPGEELFIDYGKWYWAGKRPTGMLKLNDAMLEQHRNCFNIKLLEINRNNISKRVILATQHLTIMFCVKYLLPAPNYNIIQTAQLSKMDEEVQDQDKITIENILKHQQHISKEDLLSCYLAFHDR